MKSKIIKIKAFFDRLTLNKKMNIFASAIIIPLFIIIIYLISSINTIGNSYNHIVKNVSSINNYNISFKTEIDNSLYKMVVTGINANEVGELKDYENPYELIREAKKDMNTLYDLTLAKGNDKRVIGIIKLIDTLNDRVKDIEANVKIVGEYSNNIKAWENNIQIITSLIQNQIQEYIYYEANLEKVKLELDKRQESAIRNTIIVSLIVSIIVIALVSMISRSVTKPIKNLCSAVVQLGEGDFSTRADEKVGDEVYTLTQNFNSMAYRIGELIENIKIEQKNLKDTELKLLQAQINPHFLYNTLDTIVWLAEDGKKEKVVEMITSLSDFFKTSLSQGREFITIKEEINHVKSYLEIQKVRYDDIMDYNIQVDESLFLNVLPKITLQPIVENAIYHGIKNKRTKGEINIYSKIYENEYEIIVEDNGKGISKEELEKIMEEIKGKNVTDKERGYGMYNLEARLKIAFGDKFGVRIESAINSYTKVIVKLPINTNSKIN